MLTIWICKNDSLHNQRVSSTQTAAVIRDIESYFSPQTVMNDLCDLV